MRYPPKVQSVAIVVREAESQSWAVRGQWVAMWRGKEDTSHPRACSQVTHLLQIGQIFDSVMVE